MNKTCLTLDNTKKIISEFSPNTWDKIPDINLYMDQLISYMKKQHIGFALESEENITAAMVNNYIKHNIMSRAKGKRYDKTHIAELTAICLLKQVISINDTGALLKDSLENVDHEHFYNIFKDMLLEKVDKNLSSLNDIMNDTDDNWQVILNLAISSYIQKLLCEELIKTTVNNKLSVEKEPKKK